MLPLDFMLFVAANRLVESCSELVTANHLCETVEHHVAATADVNPYMLHAHNS
jgi:hypothetical protein